MTFAWRFTAAVIVAEILLHVPFML